MKVPGISIFVFLFLKTCSTEANLCNNPTEEWSAWVGGSATPHCYCARKSGSKSNNSNQICSYPVAIETNTISNSSSNVNRFPAIQIKTEGKWKCIGVTNSGKKLCSNIKRRVCCSKLKRNAAMSHWNTWIKMDNHIHNCNCGSIKYFATKYNKTACFNPTAIEVRPLLNRRYTSISPHVVVSVKDGFSCDGSTGRTCSNFKIRFKCEISVPMSTTLQITTATSLSFPTTSSTATSQLSPITSSTATSPLSPITPSTATSLSSLTTSSNEMSTSLYFNASIPNDLIRKKKLLKKNSTGNFQDRLRSLFIEQDPLQIFRCLKMILLTSDFNISSIDECIKSAVPYATKNINRSQDRIALSIVVGNSSDVLLPPELPDFTSTSVGYVDISSNFTQFSTLLLQFRLPEYFQKRLISKHKSTSSQIVVSKTPLVDVPVLSISAFKKSTSKQLKAKVSYNFNVENATNFLTMSTRNKTSSILTQRDIVLNTSYVCSYYDMTLQGYSEAGCTTKIINSTNVECHCNHTTIFAVLLSVESYEIPLEVKILSFVTELISIICLIFTFVVLSVVRKKVKNNRIMIQINLTLALLCFHFANLFQDLALKDEITCEVFAIIIHYFLLATATWMLIEGINLFLITTGGIFSLGNDKNHKWKRARLYVGWGIPGIIVLISAVVGLKTGTYMSRQNSPAGVESIKICWLSPTTGALLAAVIIPVIVAYCVNLVIAGWVTLFLYKLRRDQVRYVPSDAQRKSNLFKNFNPEHVIATFKGLILLCPALGVSWMFSFLSGVRPYEISLVFMYLNVIFNGLQGFFLMLVYCVFGTEVREAWTQKLLNKLAF